MNNYKVEFSVDFKRAYKKYIKNNSLIEEKIKSAIKALSKDPFYSGLKTHKITSRLYGIKYSSRVTGDLRIIWDFEGSTLIICYALGGHDGGGVYK
jgi:mRNA-degrading endonuclease YafQ of YafQ-DinJ toxin-antitoxin module